ncbi:uncharacterized protein RB166_015223 [Leptodactylus fuscus]|uniref:uncharacterized protein LOC142216910 n=1 Tax=Leptodactylus fuscus TaxID=238119 RepID=UPI003F4E692E
MIRFLLLLLLLPGAELFANVTYEVETSTTTTLGSQFNMAVTTQTPLRKPLGSRAPTKKTPVHSSAPRNGRILRPPPAEETRIINTTHAKHKNSTHTTDISSTHNNTHWRPTKMPVTAKSHLQRETSIKKPIIKKVPTPPSKLKSMMKTTMKNPSARYHSPPHVHHRNATMRPGMGHFHSSNHSAGVAELAKSHRVVTPLRNGLKVGQKDVSPVAERVRQPSLGSHLNKHLRDKANSTSALLSTVTNNNTKSDDHEINHITHSFPNSSFVHEKKSMLYELNSLNSSEQVRRVENMSLVPEIDRQKDLATTLLQGIHSPGTRQSEVMQELNSKVNIKVPDRNAIYNHTKQSLRDTAELFGLGQDGTIRLEQGKIDQVSTVESVMVNGTKRTSDTQSSTNSESGVGETTQVWTPVRTPTQSEVPAHNNVEQQYHTRPELTTGGHVHHNHTHSHRHHKHLGQHKQSDNTVSQHTITSPVRSSGPNRHHLRHPHNTTHTHEHNEHWVQHQISSTQVSSDQLGTHGHPNKSPLQGEAISFHESRAAITNGSDIAVGTLTHLRKNISEPETTTPSSWKLFTTVEPKLTTQSLQNVTTVSQLTTQTQQGSTTLYDPVITDNNTGPHMVNNLEEGGLSSPYPNITIKLVTPKDPSTHSTESFQMELTTNTYPKLTQLPTHKNTEVTVHNSQKVTPKGEVELTTQSRLNFAEESQPWVPTHSQPELTTHGSYQSTQSYPNLPTKTKSMKVNIESSTEPLPSSGLITETYPHLFTKPPLTTHSPSDVLTSKSFNGTHTDLSTNSQYHDSRTTPHIKTEPITHGDNESSTQTDSVLNQSRSTSQMEPTTKENSEPTTPITNTVLTNWTQRETRTKDETSSVTRVESTTSSQMYTITQTESNTKTQTVSSLETEPSATNRESQSPVHKDMTTERYAEQPTQTQHITEATTQPTSKPRIGSITPGGTVVKYETVSVTQQPGPLDQTTTLTYGRDETESTEQTESTSKIPPSPITPYGHESPTHRGHSQSTQPDEETQTYPQLTTRARSELTPTGEPGKETSREDVTSVPGIPSVSDGHVRSHTTARPWSEASSPALTGGHPSQDGRWDSGPTSTSNVPTFYTTRSHTSERDHAISLTTVKSSSMETKSVTSPPSNMYTTQTTGEMMSAQPGKDRIFIVDEQQPVFKVQTINVTYKTNVSHHAECERPDACRPLLLQELTSAYKSTPGFDKIEILNVTVAGTALEYKVLFSVRPGSLMSAAQELVLSNPSVIFGALEKPLAYRIYNTSLTDNHVDPCTDWFACPRSFQCVPLRKLSALCLSPCHSIFCHNNGICIHRKGQDPECQCPIGRDFWYMGQTCDYRMTHHRLAAIACAVVFCIIICAAAAVFILVRRFQTQILQQKVAQTQSSYRRFSRFDDVPTHFWCPSQTWLTASASLNSLDNPAFSSSEEVFPLQALGSCVCGCQDGARSGSQTNQAQQPARAPPRLETSCSSVNDLMIDSGKASDVSVCSWPMEPIHWTPFPILHQLSLQSPFHARRPHSYFEGMELVNTERSWTA